MIKQCKTCGVIYQKDKGSRRIYCCDKCLRAAYYIRHKEKIKEHVRKWEKENPERAKAIHKKAFNKFRTEKRKRFNKLMMKTYQNNKAKWNSRSIVRKVILGIEMKKHPIPDKFCKNCKAKDDLIVHNPTELTKAKEIRKAIDNKKIYYLCRPCSFKKRRRKNV